MDTVTVRRPDYSWYRSACESCTDGSSKLCTGAQAADCRTQQLTSHSSSQHSSRGLYVRTFVGQLDAGRQCQGDMKRLPVLTPPCSKCMLISRSFEQATRERPCGYTRKSVFPISFPGDFLVVSRSFEQAGTYCSLAFRYPRGQQIKQWVNLGSWTPFLSVQLLH